MNPWLSFCLHFFFPFRSRRCLLMHTVPWLPKSLHLQTCQLLKSAKLKSEKKSAKIYWDKKWEWGVVGLALHEAEFSRWFGKMDDSVYCTWCTFQGFSFSDRLYHWRNRLVVEIGMSITTCFFWCNYWYKWKGKGCLSHLLSAPLGMVLLVDIFPQGETHTDRLDWVACLLPPSPPLISRFLFFLKYIFYTLLFFLLVVVDVCD